MVLISSRFHRSKLRETALLCGIIHLPISGTSYYRLSQTDRNGDSKAFNVLTVDNCNSNSSIYAFNDQSGAVAVIIESGETGTFNATLYDVTGRQISNTLLSTGKGHNSFSIDISGLRAGVYLISL